jgi:two-component system phosphate regulon response regulator PhoB
MDGSPASPLAPNVLVVEDEPALVELLTYNLQKAGFRTAVARDGEEAMVAVAEARPDLVLLDWMLPYVSGIEICRRIRRDPDTHDLPVILLTARGEEDDRVRGLESGADDYVVKPFSPSELIARVRAVIRRTRPTFDKDELRYADIVMDLAGHRVSRGDSTIDLGPTEFRLLRFLLEHPGRVFSREQLLDGVWGHDAYIEPRTVDVHIRRLRKAMNLPGAPDLIRTVRSAGYALELDPAA